MNSFLQSNDSLSTASQLENQLKENREQTKAAFVSLMVLIVFGFLLFGHNYLPSKFVTIVLGVVPAIYMSGFLYIQPTSLRNRRGSMTTAIGFVLFLWLIAVSTVVAIVAGAIE